jgi:hypothetical protein
VCVCVCVCVCEQRQDKQLRKKMPACLHLSFSTTALVLEWASSSTAGGAPPTRTEPAAVDVASLLTRHEMSVQTQNDTLFARSNWVGLQAVGQIFVGVPHNTGQLLAGVTWLAVTTLLRRRGGLSSKLLPRLWRGSYPHKVCLVVLSEGLSTARGRPGLLRHTQRPPRHTDPGRHRDGRLCG